MLGTSCGQADTSKPPASRAPRRPPSSATSAKSASNSSIRVHQRSSADRSSLLRRTIFALCRERGIGDDLRHELQLSVTGKPSLRDCTTSEMRAILDRLSGRNTWTPQGIMNKLASELDNGALRLRAFTWQRFNKEPDDLDANEVRSAIACLRNWLAEQRREKGQT